MSWNLATFTIVHVVISLIGIASGLVVMFGLLNSKTPSRWTVLFLITTVATSVTGLLFPFHGFTAAIGGSIFSLILLAVAILARYARQLAGVWRWVYVVTVMSALYLNVFSLIVQLFLKVPALTALAPTLSELPFLAIQVVVLASFVILTILAVKKFQVAPLRAV